MEVTTLKHDSRCIWLENKVMKGLYPEVMRNARNPQAEKQYLIVDWISNDNGKVGVDLNWLKTLGVPAVQSYKDLPKGEKLSVINTGYDSIVHEEKILKEQGVNIIDEPCPFIRRLRELMEKADDNYQYVYLCEPNHITMKNFERIFPKDMIFLQMDNYQDRLREQANGKPLKLIPYVTFLPKHVEEIMHFMAAEFPDIKHQSVNAHCLWVKSKASPIVEINHIDDSKIDTFDAALIITGSAVANKSLISIIETCEDRGLNVVNIETFNAYRDYGKKHPNHHVLLIRSPIPNNTEKYIMSYLEGGLISLWKSRFINHRLIRIWTIGLYNRFAYAGNWIKLKVSGKLKSHKLTPSRVDNS